MATSKLSTFCNGMIEAGWLAALIVAPLYFSGYSSTVMDADKLTLLRVIVSVMIAAWVIQWIDQRRSARSQPTWSLRSPLVIPVLALALAYLLATFTSLTPLISFFGAYHRPQGTYALLAYILVLVMILHGLRTRQQLDRLILTIILTSFPIALYGIYQKLGLEPLKWSDDFPGRVGSTLGNPIFLAAYLLMIFPLTASRMIDCLRSLKTVQRIHPPEIFGAMSYAVILIVQSGAIFFSISRGPWLGWFVGIFLFAALTAITLGRRRLVLGAFGLGVAGVAILIALNVPNTPLQPVRDLPGLYRLSRLTDPTGEFRLFTWQNVARLVLPHAPLQFPDGTPDRWNVIRPLVGYGPDAMALAYPQFALASPFSHEAGIDRSHNATWDALVMTGALGFVAYQLLFLSIFVFGLRWLGLLENDRARNLFVALWSGLGALGGLAAIALGQPGLLGVSVPAGNVMAILVILVRAAIHLRQSSRASRSLTDQFLAAALVAGLGGHYVESQFGIAVPATWLLVFTFAGMLVALGSARIVEDAVVVAPKTRAAGYGVLIAIILATLLYEFIGYDKNISDPFTIIWRALSYSPAQNATSYAVLGLVLSVTLLAVLLILSETARSRIGDATMDWRGAAIWLTTIPFALAALFAFGLAQQVGALLHIPTPVARIEDVVTLSAQAVGIVDWYTMGLLGLIVLLAGAFLFEAQPIPAVWSVNRWSAVALVPVVALTFLWVNTFNLNPNRADVTFRLAKLFEDQIEWNAALALDKQAIAYAPTNDWYYMALGRVYQAYARTADPSATARLSADTARATILNLDSASIAQLSRLDLLYAAQAMLLHARELNPLYADHTLNLARFYVPEPLLNSPSKTKLAELSARYYAQATGLSPSNPLLWNEWAEFDLTTRNDPDAALQKLTASLARDSKFAPTYVLLGKVFVAKNDFANASEAYQRALALQPNLVEAQSKLAFTYYRQGKIAESIVSYLKYVELAPDAANLWEAHKNLALLYGQVGDTASALDEARAAIRLAPVETKPLLADLEAQLRNQAGKP